MKKFAASAIATSVFLSLAVGGAILSPAAYAADSDVVISELMYNASSGLDGDEFLEIANRGTTPVDIAGWCLTGVTFCFPAGASLAGGGFAVISPDAARSLATYGVTTAGVYTGSLRNSGEVVSIRDEAAVTISSVSYLDVAPWPVTPDELGPSLELIDATLSANDPLNWAAATNDPGQTAGAPNSVRRSGLAPLITAVVATPTAPAANTPFTVTATITGQVGTPVVQYRVDFAAQQSVAMTNLGGGNFSATIPGAAAGHLIRYRVQATNASATSQSPRTDDTISYYGVVVSNGVTSAIPIIEWFIAPADYAAITGSPTVEIDRLGVVAYNGTVYDNVLMNIKGASSQSDAKPSWKFEFPHNHDFSMPTLIEPVDEFAVQADFSDHSFGRSVLSWESARQVEGGNMQIFPIRIQRNSAFGGLYKFLEAFDGTWRDREGHSADQFFKAEHGGFDATRILYNYRFEKKDPDETDYSMLQEFLDAVDLTGAQRHDFLQANVDIPQLINYAGLVSVIEHHDSLAKNFFLSQESTTGRWESFIWDLDHTYGNGCCGVVSTFVTPAEPGDRTSELMQALLADPVWRAMYFRHVRTLADRILAPGALQATYDARMGPAAPEAALDYALWPHPVGTTYAQQRTRLSNDINARRAVFNADARVPASQAANANVVINELHTTPTGGATAEYVELTNPTATAIDVSGWILSGAVDLTIQQGAVLLPGASVVFVANDPGFRATYTSQVLVGDRFAGELEAAGTLTLTRPDASVADSIDYGGAGWPDASAGLSLELTTPTADNNNAANWTLSAGPEGTPGAANNAADTSTVPGATQVQTAAPGDASASVTWRPPFSDGGAAVTGYQVRAVNGAGTQVGPLVAAAASARVATVTGLANGTAVRLQVAAINRRGTGAYSALSLAVTPAAGLTVPGRPNIGASTQGAVGGNVSVFANWTPPASTGGTPITGYQVRIMRMSSAAANAHVVSSILSEVMAASARRKQFVVPAANYRAEVVAINAIGTSVPSLRSNAVVPR